MSNEMTAAAPTPQNVRYRRLPGRGRRMSSQMLSGESQRLYAAPDHLLVVRRTGYDESAKRFFYGDIQAITLQTNYERLFDFAAFFILLLVLAGIAGGILSQGVSPFEPGMYVLYAFMVVPVLFLIRNLARGPSCTVRLHTAVQVEEITALRRVRVARKCLAILRPLIEADQGGVYALPQDAAAPGAIPAATANVGAGADRFAGKKPVRPMGRALPVAAFGLFFVEGLSALGDLFYRSDWKNTLDLVLTLVLLILFFVVVIRQSGSTLPRTTQRLVWSSLIFLSVTFFFGMYAVTVITLMGTPNEAQNPFVMMSPADTSDLPEWLYVAGAVAGAIQMVLALLGLASLRGYRIVRRAAAGGSPQSP